jgi:putative transcriptional regulator
MGTSFEGHFLVAMPSLGDPNFHRTVVLVCRHDTSEGAFGLVLNRPLDIPLASLLEGFPGVEGRTDRVHLGGPVNTQSLWLLHRDPGFSEGCTEVASGLFWGSDTGVLERILKESEREASGSRFRCYLGYSGWSAKQLEGEIKSGSWVVVEASAADAFAEDGQALWARLVKPPDFPFPMPPDVFDRYPHN